MTGFKTWEEAMATEGRELLAAVERAKARDDVEEIRRIAGALDDLAARYSAQADVLSRAHDLLLPYWPEGGTFGEALARARASADSRRVSEIEALLPPNMARTAPCAPKKERHL
jgi:hypothetical protein